MTRTIDVYGDWMPGQQPFKIGTMVVDRVRGKESLSFTDDVDWLSQPDALTLDPDLQLYQGLQYPPNSKRGGFGVFLDSSPDHWGRMLKKATGDTAFVRFDGVPKQCWEAITSHET